MLNASRRQKILALLAHWRRPLVIFGLAMVVIAVLSPRIGLGDGQNFFIYQWLGVPRRELALFGLLAVVMGALAPQLLHVTHAGIIGAQRIILYLCALRASDISGALRQIEWRARPADISNRYEEFSGFHVRLQSMRGIAALMVAVGHSLILIEKLQVYNADTLRWTNALAFFLQLVFQADTAVIFFFVLSGFVLGQSIRTVQGGNFLLKFCAFTVKRLGRLLPLYWLSVAFMYGYLVTGYRQYHEFAAGWLNKLFPNFPSLNVLGLNLIAVDTSINPILWSIQAELAMIFLLPAITWLVSKASLWINVTIVGITLFVTCFGFLPRCLSYVFCFHIGILLPVLAGHPLLKGVLSNRWALPIALIGLFVTEAIHRLGYMPFTPWINLQFKYLFDAILSLVIIANALRRPDLEWMHILDYRLIVALGAASYGFYVIHLLFMDILTQTLFSGWPGVAALNGFESTVLSLAVALLSVFAAFVVAAMLHRLIELPGIRFGRILADKISFKFKRDTNSHGATV